MSAAACLLGALALWLPSGYSIGAVLLLITSLGVLWRLGLPRLSAAQWGVAGVMLLYSLVWMLDGVLRGGDVRALDQASRLIFAIPVLLASARVVLYWPLIWVGCSVGGVGAFVIAWHQVESGGLARAAGFIGPEPFANIAALLAGLGLFGGLWFWRCRAHAGLLLMAVVGSAGALGALILSETRASWIAFVGVLCVAAAGGWLLGTPRERLRLGVVAALAGALLMGLFAEPVSERIAATYDDLQSYQAEAGPPRSIGNRFEVWRGSLQLFAERPLWGWGAPGYDAAMTRLAATGVIHERAAHPVHAHNQLIDALAKKGLIGAVVLLAVYGVPALLFARCVRGPRADEERLVCLAALAMIANFFLYGMAHTVLENNAAVMNYGFWLALLAGAGLGHASPPAAIASAQQE